MVGASLAVDSPPLVSAAWVFPSDCEADDDDCPAATTLMSELRFSSDPLDTVPRLVLANGSPLPSVSGLEVTSGGDVDFVFAPFDSGG